MTSDVQNRAPAIVTRELTKAYRLYRQPHYKFLDLIGLCPDTPDYYREHIAMQGVNLRVERGEKVAIIGRNGAGKSTLLKLIAGLVRPTSGEVSVHGHVSNLLQLGTGFHPEFTGRQNIYSNLAHQGITGRAADRAFDEILAFAEIPEYIDQPMKTYSTGMCSRLMFSSSVILKPDILIVDEILGVGDAYFSHKSFEKMRRLCSEEQTTLLLVTHDIYSAMNLCERFVWIDRGEIKFDGESRTGVTLYEGSIKEQEERSQRAEAVRRFEDASQVKDGVPCHVLVRSRTGFALPKPLALFEISLLGANGEEWTLRPADPDGEWELSPQGNVGPVETVDGRRSRSLQDQGSIYHKAEWITSLPPNTSLRGARVTWNYSGSESAEFAVFSDIRNAWILGDLTGGTGWQERLFPAVESSQELRTIPQVDYGTGAIRAIDMLILGADGQPTTVIRHGDPMTLQLRLQMAGTLPERRITVAFAMTRPNTPYAVNVVEHDLSLPPDCEECVVQAVLPSLRLGAGIWYLRMGIAEANLFDRESMKYFAVDDGWYHISRDDLRFEVLSVSHLDKSGCFVLHPATVTARRLPDARTVAVGEPGGL